MVKQLFTVIIAALAVCGTTAYAAKSELAGGALYEWVVEPQYEEINQVTENYFVAEAANTPNGAVELYDLCDWQGKAVIQGKTSYEFFNKWILAMGMEHSAVYTYDDATCRIPEDRGYVRIWFKDNQTAVGLKAGEFRAPGIWIGPAEEIDLATGEVTKQLGIIMEESSALPTRFRTSDELFATANNSPYGVTFVNDSADATSNPMSVHQIQVYNKDGQLLFDTGANAGKVWTNMTVSCNGTIFGFYGDDGTSTARNQVYTGRGRKLLDRNAIGLLGGRYLAVMEDDCHDILTRDGELVLTGLQEVHGNYAVLNNDGSGYGDTVATSDDLVIVKQNDRWGILRLTKSAPKPSGWATEEVSHAVKADLVPEDIQLWWRDSCTRLEFCQMLARTLEAASGHTLAELVNEQTKDATNAANVTAATFSDCQDTDVLAVASLGIIQGVGEGKFAPGRFLTRQQAATLFSRAAQVLSITGTATAPDFADADQFASWAADGIHRVASIVSKDGKAVMQGVGNGKFAPAKYYTVEQSAVTLYRLLLSLG